MLGVDQAIHNRVYERQQNAAAQHGRRVRVLSNIADVQPARRGRGEQNTDTEARQRNYDL